MDFLVKVYPQVLFIVASDDLNATKNALKGRKKYISLGNVGPEDMALLSLTNHTIMYLICKRAILLFRYLLFAKRIIFVIL